jgi:hypothetical protein
VAEVVDPAVLDICRRPSVTELEKAPKTSWALGMTIWSQHGQMLGVKMSAQVGADCVGMAGLL